MKYLRSYKSFVNSQYLYEGVKVTAGILIPALLMTNLAGANIAVRKCSELSEQLRNIQSILQLKPKPFTKRKSVVHKSELKKTETQYLQASPPI